MKQASTCAPSPSCSTKKHHYSCTRQPDGQPSIQPSPSSPASRQATRSAPAATMPKPDVYTVRMLQPPLSVATQEKIYQLLLGFGPDYQRDFGVDMRARLAAAPGADGSGLICAVAESGAHDIVAHACAIFDPMRPHISLLAHVFTDPSHRKRGLCRRVVELALRGVDAAAGAARRADMVFGEMSMGSSAVEEEVEGWYTVLGTGSPYAARTYERLGFVHLAGGLDSAGKGYNPDDLGEWIMLRTCAEALAFSAAKHFKHAIADSPKDRKQWNVEPLRRDHWAELVLLFNSFSREEFIASPQCTDAEPLEPPPNRQLQPKLAVLGVNDGLDSEEKLCQLFNRVCASDMPCIDECETVRSGEAMSCKPSSSSPPVHGAAYVARHFGSDCLAGLAVRFGPGGTVGIYTVPACCSARQALEAAFEA